MFWKIFDTKAIRVKKRELAKQPDDAEAHFNLGVEYERVGRVEAALSEFRETLRLNPKSAEAHYNLSLLSRELKQGDEAIEHMIQAGNIFSERNDKQNHMMARNDLKELYKIFKKDSPDNHEENPQEKS